MCYESGPYALFGSLTTFGTDDSMFDDSSDSEDYNDDENPFFLLSYKEKG